MRKASICLGANSALTGAGRELLTLLRKPEVYEFQRISEALKDALSVLYITSAVDEFTEVFIDDDAEVSPKIVHITSCRLADENEIHFDVSGVFEIRVTDPIESTIRLRQVEEEFEGFFDNGIVVQVAIFESEGDDILSEAELVTDYEELSVWVES